VNDAATVMNSPKTIRVGNREYRLHPLDFDDHGEIQRFLNEQVRNPLEIVRKEIERGGFPLEIQKYMVKAAIEVAARTRILIGTPEADEIMDSIEGRAKLLQLSIRKGDPSFTYDKAMALIREMNNEARAQAVAAADMLRADEDPKSSAGAGSTSRDTGTPSPSTGGAGNTP
jgi:hypothetical protein